MSIRVESVCSSAGTGRQANAIDWQAAGDLGAIAADTSVALVAPAARVREDARPTYSIVHTAHWHKHRVVCVRWLQTDAEAADQSPVLCSADAGGTAALWTASGRKLYMTCALHAAHERPILYCCGMKHTDASIVLTSGTDGRVQIWNCSLALSDGGQWSPALQYSSAGGPKAAMVLAMALAPLGDGIVIAAGGHDAAVALYYAPYDRLAECRLLLTLTGHTDWVRAVQFKQQLPHDDGIYLASSSQDTHIRIWRISSVASDGDHNDHGPIRTKSRCFDVPSDSGAAVSYCVSLEAVLSGHDEWVYSLRWHPSATLELVSASMDKSVVVWRPHGHGDQGDGAQWLECARLGVAGGQQHAGYYGAVYAHGGSAILANAYNGGVHSWHRPDDASTQWQAAASGVGGHSSPVVDIDWEPNQGAFVLSTGADMTSRLWAPCVLSSTDDTVRVCELARPQVHGYAMQCVKCIGSGRFVSAGEEKLLRAFVVPAMFVHNWHTLARTDGGEKLFADYSAGKCATGAGVPSLGLSNKAIYSDTAHGEHNANDHSGGKGTSGNDECDAGPFGDTNLHFTPIQLNAAPTEDHLMQNTLWPEEHKLYGHGLEVYAVTCNCDASLIASSSKASQATHAAIHIWRRDDKRSTWLVADKLLGHKLTVTSLRFAPRAECRGETEWLLSVSRDRTWTIFSVDKDAAKCARLAGGGGHSRIIWDCAWAPDARHFITVSRDKKIIVWSVGKSDESELSVGKAAETLCTSAVTAVDISLPWSDDGRSLVAAGMEDGTVQLHYLEPSGTLTECHRLPPDSAHCAAINRLKFRPVRGAWPLAPRCCACANGLPCDCLMLATASDDHFMKIFAVGRDGDS